MDEEKKALRYVNYTCEELHNLVDEYFHSHFDDEGNCTLCREASKIALANLYHFVEDVNDQITEA